MKQFSAVQIQEDVDIQGSISELHNAAENNWTISDASEDPRSRVTDSDIDSIELSRLSSTIMFKAILKEPILSQDAGDVAIPKNWSSLYYLMPLPKAIPFLPPETAKRAIVETF
jgi:hypothetical protein